MNPKLMLSKKSDDWTTPIDFFKKLDDEFHFTDDPCPLHASDGLLRDWGEIVFCNPPYSNIKGFVAKALIELKKNTKIVVFLIPSRTDTKIFHEILVPYSEIRFIKGRLKFGGRKTCAPFPSLLAIFKSDKLCL